ncbi:Ig-like domain-containing protein [Colwellia sp. 6M3]|uniref:Ig-like domain-containing protein n=1 Tax=Colwellia sp. 6M3 TaxID=2759849 RepID=UPI0015F6116A|nr:Ig-like domain-containing protein [Colwellia sp. 6M3]MBA6417994.1 Ig-like domain-containing protein [Colwellia sp. 6M3]
MALLQRFSLILLFATLVGCGGSSGGFEETTDGSDGSTPDAITISLAISDTTVTGAAPVTVTATVMQGTTAVVARAVTFSSGLGAFSPTSGTALTNDSGVAEITLTAGSVRGAAEISATISSGESSTIPLGFTTQGDDIGVVDDINVSVTLVDSDGNPTDTITSSKPGKAIATVNGINAPLIVTFSSTVGDLPITTAITDDNNQAYIDIFSGNTLGAGSITATLPTGESGQVLLVVGATSLKMGGVSPFIEKQAEVSLAQISAGGTSVISVSILDDENNLFTESVDINFTSGCSSLETPTATLSTPITTSNGIATSTYLAKGCVGNDPISVTANAGGINLSATATLNVLPADVGSIEFVSATPELIAIQGTGSADKPESSTLLFRVLDTNGNPVNNQDVDFILNTDVGGINLIPESATTNSQGIVQTVVNSGTVSRTVRVTASISDSAPVISTQSSELIISTGIPDQDSFSISADILNPEAWDLDGTEVVVTARLADAFNNPPPPTVVFFTTEGGSIDSANSSCTTNTDGACSVIWRSQFPKPDGHVIGDVNNVNHVPELVNSMGQKFGGRATILATTIGEESFPDLNGNGRFDVCEVVAFTGGTGKPCNPDGSINTSGADITYTGNDVSGRAFDLAETFVDYNEDGIFNPGVTGGELGGELETPSDFNRNGVHDGKDGKYNGALCAIPAHDGCSTQQSLDVRGSLVLVMSGSDAFGVINSTNDAVSGTIDDDNDPNTPEIVNPNDDPSDDTVYIAGENTGFASVIISDLHNQPMPAGSIVSFEASVGSIVGPSSFTWNNHNKNGGSGFGVAIKGAQEPASGVLLISVETPNGAETILSGVNIVIQ